MQTNRNIKQLSTFTATILFLIFLNTACLQQKAASTAEQPAENGSTRSSTAAAETEEIAEARKFIEKMPDEPQGYNTLAVLYIRQARKSGDFGLNTKADEAVDRALGLAPENYTAKMIKASLLLTFHRFDEGLKYGQRLQREHPKDAFVYGVLTDANVELGNYKEAVDAIQQMVDLRPNMESYSRVALVRSLHGDSKGAIDAMTTAAKIADPKDLEAKAWCLVHLGEEYFKAGRYDEAEKAYDEALSVLPTYHFALSGKGKARAAAGDYENAVKFYTQAQEKVPLTGTVIELGNIYKKTGKTEEANKQYELAEFIEQKLGNIDQRTLALLWADQDIKLEQALQIAAAEHAKRKDIFTADIYAWTLYKNGKFDEAKIVIAEAMRLKTKDARFFYHAGMIEKDLGNKRAAADYLKKALELNPSFDILQAEKAASALKEIN